MIVYLFRNQLTKKSDNLQRILALKYFYLYFEFDHLIIAVSQSIYCFIAVFIGVPSGRAFRFNLFKVAFALLMQHNKVFSLQSLTQTQTENQKSKIKNFFYCCELDSLKISCKNLLINSRTTFQIQKLVS